METFFVTKVSHRIFGENSVVADGWLGILDLDFGLVGLIVRFLGYYLLTSRKHRANGWPAVLFANFVALCLH
jgi:hypothetical protein